LPAKSSQRFYPIADLGLTLGGALIVRHQGKEIEFDWSKDSQSIQWGAFYSDCEHEVLPVTSGYRLTLAYNLYYKKLENQIPQCVNGISASLPLYHELSNALKSKEFLPNGISL